VKRADALKEDASLIREIAWSLSLARVRDKLLQLADECERIARGEGKASKAEKKPRGRSRPVDRRAPPARRPSAMRRTHQGHA